MKRLWKGCLGLALGLTSHEVSAQDIQWRPVTRSTTAPGDIGVRLLPPQPLPGTDTSKLSVVQPVAHSDSDTSAPRVVRAQSLDPAFGPGPVPPPPPFAPPQGAVLPPSSDNEKYNCAVKANSQGFFEQAGDTITGIPQAVGNVFTGGGSAPFQSDHCFDFFCSPVSNPFYFEDPRALTEIKPLVIFQKVPTSNSAFQGGDVWFYGLQGRLAFSDQFSLVIEKLGAVTFNPGSSAKGITSSTGFAEFMLGPKFTFYRNEATRTVLAAGMSFDLAIGNSEVFQNTGDLSICPYFSVGQNWFGFNFMNTTGYSFAVDNERTDFLFSSFHVSYDVGGLNKIFPLVELNYFHYTTNGSAPSTFGFEGRDLVNFGSGGVAGQNDLSIALGARYKFAEWIQTGLVFEMPLIHHANLMSYRIGFDLIFRY